MALAAGACLRMAAVAPAAEVRPVPRPLGQVVPAPATVRPAGVPYVLGARATVSVPAGSPEAEEVGADLAGMLRRATGFRIPVTHTAHRGGIALRLGGDPAAGPEGYRLEAGGAGVVIRAGTAAGLFHGAETLRQLLPAAVESSRPALGPWTVPGGTIVDRPRYAYRGAMLDVARHFFTVGQVERYIDELALYKMNYLHLHLTDDQGWRIAIPAWPRLAAYGGSTEVGGGRGGYYTQQQYRRIVRYARRRFVTIVPEIDMPAHTHAALASYPQLGCDGVAPPLQTGIGGGSSSLCVSKETTYTFVRDVLCPVAALTPGPFLHIGGDEAHATPAADYRTFMDRVQPMVTGCGKRVMAWHEITGADPIAGTVVQYWGTARSAPRVAAAAQAGDRVVMSPANHAYLDMKYDKSTRLGLSWAGYTEVRDAYDWNPDNYLAGVPLSAVYGVEAPLWSETLTSSADIDYLAFPRLPAIAELGWSPTTTHDWARFASRLAAQGPRWDLMGVGYYRSPQVPWPVG